MRTPLAADSRGALLLPVPPDGLVGRSGDLALLERLLTAPDSRLVTLTGPPGVGKTRLAVAAAQAVADRVGRVAFLDLTIVREPAAVAAGLAEALDAADPVAGDLGVVQHATAGAAVHPATRDPLGSSLLLVVDNFEHVLPAAEDLAAALARRPGLRVLVTSRERLHLRAEREVPVLPLPLPQPADVEDPARLAGVASVEMLVQRVRAFQPDFAVTPANRAALAEICIGLDGLPLALELAAARLRLFSPGELTFRIRHRVAALSSDTRDVPERHRTLRAALAWSHELLSPDERALFRRLSVFVGGWTLEGARAVCDVPDVVSSTSSLVDKSLVRRQDAAGMTHLGMLESLREYAAELLVQNGEDDATRTRHTRYFAELAVQIEARIGTAQERAAVDEVGVQAGNLREGLAHCLSTGQAPLALPLAAALGWYSYTRGQLGSGQVALEAALALAFSGGDPPLDALAGALLMAGIVAFARGELDRAQQHLTRTLALGVDAAPPRREAIASAFLGHLARATGRHDDAVEHYRRAGRLHAQLGNVHGVAWSQYDLGLLARRRDEPTRAADLLRDGLRRFRALDYPWAVGCAAAALAAVELGRGRRAEAAALLGDALAQFEATDDARGLAQCLEQVAALACARSEHPQAARLLSAAAALRDRLAAPLPGEDEAVHRAVVLSVDRALGAEAADQARCAGRGLSSGAAVERARGVLAAVLTAAAAVPEAPLSCQPLSAREHDVALLVRQGCTNRQVGRQLGISEKTVEVHVHHLMRKLGASSRAQVAAWVALRERPLAP